MLLEAGSVNLFPKIIYKSMPFVSVNSNFWF